MRVLVVEHNHRGHHLVYVRLLLQALCGVVDQVVLSLSREARETSEYQHHIAPLALKFEVDVSSVRHTGSATLRAWRDLKQLDRLVREHRIDHVLIPDAPYLVPISGPAKLLGACQNLRATETEVGWIRCRFAYPAQSPRRRLKLTAVAQSYRWSPWRRFHTIDAIAYQRILQRGDFLARRFHLVPDPLDPYTPQSREVARRQLGLPEDGRYLGFAGSMGPRQGIGLLARAFGQAQLRKNDRLLLVGRLPQELRETLERELRELIDEGRVILLDHYVSDADFMLALSALDLVVTPYLHDLGPSGVILRAAQAERPVLATDAGWPGHMVPRFGLGWTGNVHDPRDFARQLARSLDRAQDHRNSEAARRLLTFSSPENFQAAWTVRIRERLALDPIPATPWAWVQESLGSV